MSAPPVSVGIVGGGAWGVALALAAHRTGSDVVLFTRREHPEGERGLNVTSSYAEVAKARLLVIAVPSAVARTVLRSLGDHLDGSHLVIHGVRGLGIEHLETVSDIVREETPARRLGALGGPVQADELTAGRPSAMVCGSRFPEVIAA
ncbi:MAG TPA: NAD(P)-binding domain-containing protein, partial [Polyangiaceae bacterium]|nr:NAD(P)-binding domain-containing protein [Polyangiaceae bacterium]